MMSGRLTDERLAEIEDRQRRALPESGITGPAMFHEVAIVLAREDVPDLLAEVRKLRQVVDATIEYRKARRLRVEARGSRNRYNRLEQQIAAAEALDRVIKVIEAADADKASKGDADATD